MERSITFISECNKLVQNILRLGITGYHTKKWYMHNSASVQENEMLNVLWDFVIQTDLLISARQPGLIKVNKKENLLTCRLCRAG